MIRKSILTSLVLKFVLVLNIQVIAAEVQVDFAKAGSGEIVCRTEKGDKKVFLEGYSPYGRVRGKSAVNEPGMMYPQQALGRSGKMDALRFGNVNKYFTVPEITLDNDKPFTVETWIYVYGTDKSIHGYFIDADFGYKTGFRLTYARAKYAPDGWILLISGDQKTSKNIYAKNGGVDAWHHVVLTGSGKEASLYVDGGKAGSERKENYPERFFFNNNTKIIFGGSRRSKKLDFKADYLAVSDQVMSAETVKKRYEAGKATNNQELEEQFKAINLEIPYETQGYFNIGEDIPVTVSVPDVFKADQVIVNGQKYGMEDIISVKYDKTGIYNIDISVLAGGKLISNKVYPVAIIPPTQKKGALFCTNGIIERTPASYVLGTRLSREVVKWSDLEPKKGEYYWNSLDKLMEKNAEKNIQTVLCLTRIPGWAKIPQDIDKYKKLWELILARYDVKYCEVWDAQRSSWTHCDLEIYKQLVVACHEAARNEDESIKVLAGRYTFGKKNTLEELKPVAGSFDIYSTEFDNFKYAGQLAESVAAMDKPVWITCGGFMQFANSSAKKEMTDASLAIKNMVAAYTAGVKKYFMAYGPDEYQPYPNNYDGRPGYRGLALGVFNSIIGSDAILQRIQEKPGLACIKYENSDKSVGLIVYAKGGGVEVTLPANAQAVTLFGDKITTGKVKIGKDPLYITGASAL